jgi:hypothetical protein
MNDRPTNGFENWKENKLLKRLLSKELEGKLKDELLKRN